MRGRSSHPPDSPRDSRSDYWGVVLEAPDPHALARFYSELLGWEVVSEDTDGAGIIGPDGVAYVGFQLGDKFARPVWPPEEGTQRATMHLDFEVVDLEAAVAHARELGAVDASHQPQDNVRVMLDPAGHPFCLYRDG